MTTKVLRIQIVRRVGDLLVLPVVCAANVGMPTLMRLKQGKNSSCTVGYVVRECAREFGFI